MSVIFSVYVCGIPAKRGGYTREGRMTCRDVLSRVLCRAYTLVGGALALALALALFFSAIKQTLLPTRRRKFPSLSLSLQVHH